MLKTVSSITNAIGALNYKGTWNANANSPALASSVGTKGDYYVVGTAGATNLNGITNWGIGDWAAFNGSVWQRVEGGADLNGVNLTVSGTSTLSGNAIISVTDNTNAALRITQLGTGNALLVEDSTNPDTTPFVINSNGVVTAGYTTTVGFGSASQPLVNVISVSNDNGGGLLLSKFRNSAVSSSLDFIKSRSSTIGTNTIVQSGDTLGNVLFSGADGAGYINSASIIAAVDGTPGTNDMPGRLVFSTTADGASSPTERLRIDSTGDVTLSTGNLIQGTAAKGINFTANTPAAGMTSELLNWYEEGTWTMGLSFGGGTTGITYTVNTGRYIRIGKSVTVTGFLLLSSKGSSTGAAVLTGLPFTIGAGNPSQSVAAIRIANTTFIGQYQAVSSIGTTNIDLGVDNGATGTPGNLVDTNFANNSLIQLSYTYFVD
jgi:hypothetical protein